jgi:uncharacterized protein YcfL
LKKAAIAVLALLLITGCTSEVAQKSISQTVYFVTDTPRGLKLVSEKQKFVAQGELSEFIIAQLISGKISPIDPDYVNLWDGSHTLNSISVEGSRATVDIDLGKLNVGSEGETRAIDQIVWTLTEVAPLITIVNFKVNGEVVETFAGHVDLSTPFQRAPDYEVLNALQITSMAEGAKRSNPVSISGMACTFEANVVWSVRNERKTVEQGFTTARAACPIRSKWSVTLPQLEPGNYIFEVFEYSAEDGALVASDDKSFEIN